MRRPLLLLLVGAQLCASCTSSSDDPTNPAPATGSPGSISIGQPGRVELDLRLVNVSGDGVRGAVGARALEEPSERVRRALEDLYEVALAGRPAALLVHFAGRVRDQVHPERLMISAAEPERAVLKLRFLVNAHERAAAAFAEVEFEGSAIRADTPVRVVQRADYVLRKLNGAWRIVSYRVHRRVSRERMETAFAPGLPGRDPTFILVIGSDARPGASVTHTRADSIHIVGVNPRLGRASVVGIPRDSWVQIPGAGTDKINAALVRGGPELLVDTVERLAGLRIDGYVVTGFEGFTAIVDAVGGFDIRIPYAIDDALARADFEPGPDHLDGKEALALSRARHDVPTGDFGRSLNQGRVMIAALGTLREQVARGGTALLPWVIAGTEHLRTDLTIDDIFELVLAASVFEPRRVSNAVVPGGTGRVGSRSVVFLGAGASAMFRDLARDGVVEG